MAERILITGPFGQIGTDLIPVLQEKYGKDNVIALGHNRIPEDYDGVLEKGDITDVPSLMDVIKKHKITQVYHLAGLLSAVGEKNPSLAWKINLMGLKNVLDIAVETKIRVFWASSIAVFGPTTPLENTPQSTIIEPTTMYGVAKRAGELLSVYYHKKFGVDVRSLRFPGIISWKQEPGGGTTDYAVAIYYDGLRTGKYKCFVKEDTILPMMYMDDAIRAAIELMDASDDKIKVRSSYNLAAISFTVKELAKDLKRHIPDLKVTYEPDERQAIADSWPNSIDDSVARKEWGWKHDFTLSKMTDAMVENLKKKLGVK